ncbi:oxygen-independent coproporphyrinogen III oxidase [uncultured Sphingomonas sp.]|uniref:oxygen-independent coproporphyrinogen III oxidase n=1 Tax=uncultured Sphingomonas sp. TaxID=158754 RepID=UPI0030DCE04C
MATYHPDLARQAIPRYTSYPTAVDFTPAVGPERQALALLGVAPDTPVSLYIHVPYCREICWYCGCNTGATGRPARLDAYVDALLAEIGLVAGLLDGRVRSIHFGGGSPNALSPAQLLRLAEAIRDQFGVDTAAEWAMEIDPRGFDTAYADTLAAIGIRRVSIGVQTFAPAIQRAINRVQPYEAIALVAERLHGVGIRHLNFDLMYGLPGQRAEDIAETIAAALTLHPARVAMFGYAHLPAMIPRQRMIDAADLPDPQQRFAHSALTHDLLVGAGYAPIGFDHFARADDPLAIAAVTGRLRRNFQGFTDDEAEAVIGIGASAISQFDGLIVQNEKHVGRYRAAIAGGHLATTRGVVRNAEDRLRGAIIERLLCDGQVDLAALCGAHRLALTSLLDALVALAPLEQRGIARWCGGRLYLDDGDRAYRRVVAAAFDARRRRAAAPASLAV